MTYAKDNLRTVNDFDTACTIIYARSLEMAGRYGKAERVYRKATQCFLHSPDLWLTYGFFLYKLRKYAEAEQALETSIRQNPFVPSAHYLMGYSLLENKNNPACLQAWLFGLMIDADTLRSADLLRIIYYYVQQRYDSIHIPFFGPRLSLKYPDQLFFYNYNPHKFEDFYLQLDIPTFCKQLTEKITQYKIPTPYSRFYRALAENDLLETYCYFTFRKLNRKELKGWYQLNRKKLEQLAEFLDTQLAKPF
ncbi:MAG: tetratricopeptide repeat protein, partial [Bacteroidales bacterium]